MNPEVYKYLDRARELLDRGYYSRGDWTEYTLARQMYEKLEKGKKTIKERFPVIPIVY